MLTEPTTARLDALVTGREHSLFADDVANHAAAFDAAIRGRRLLVLGGAGSIGSATVRVLLEFAPAAVHVVDHDENGLASLARDIRAAGRVRPGTDIRLMPLDYGSHLARQYYGQGPRYELVLHFAALKHVRSEKDPISILQMIETNVLKQQDLLNWLSKRAPDRYFTVSTDKAANPVSFMGASKRLMEHLVFTDATCPISQSARTSARFANVAFSAGSLLESFGERLRRRQPVAVPRQTKRFFVTLEESAHICLLAATAVRSGNVAVPRMEPSTELHELQPIAEGFLAACGFRPVLYTDERSARQAVESDAAAGRWPLLLTSRDTDGEKPFEEFVGRGEHTDEGGFGALLMIPQRGIDGSHLTACLERFRAWSRTSESIPSRDEIRAALNEVVPEFEPLATGRSLDDRI